jgi:hypothetical protein
MKEASALASIFFIIVALFMIAGDVSASPYPLAPTPQPTPMSGRVATTAEVQKATIAWSQSAHADTYDDGMGANATCARCKSPRNWDPTGTQAQEQALDCNACKRVPGAPRPDLESGVPVAQAAWHNIGCDVCHQPIGDSYSVAPNVWNNDTQQYEAVHDLTELCGHCHEGRHGFEVIAEQKASVAHRGWACTRCHGVHQTRAACTDCHDPTKGRGAAEHAQHPQVNCTACHDAGGLGVALETDAPSRLAARHEGTYITMRFAHTVTSWPSHNLQTTVDCRRCHHPQGLLKVPVAEMIGCNNARCHGQGASLNWCPIFSRDQPASINP